MNFLKLVIKNEMISVSLALLIIVLGLFSLKEISIRLYPKVTVPVISIKTIYPGASQEVVQGFITSRLENVITGISHINYITSSSSKGSSQIQVHLQPNTDVQSVMVNIMDKLNEQKSYLPNEVKGPIVEQASEDSPSMIIAFTSNKMSRVQLAEYLRRVSEPELEVVNGVGQASVLGPQYALKINLDPTLLSAYSLTATDVLSALKQENILAQIGDLEGKSSNYDLDMNSYFNNSDAFNQLLLKQTDNQTVHLSDVGNAKFESENNHINAFYNGHKAVMVFVKLIPGANPLTVSKQITKVLSQMQNHLPYDAHYKVILNVADYIHDSIREVLHALTFALLITLIVLIGLLGSWRSALIPLVTIPVSLIGCLFFMWLMGYSINTLTLLAMVLAVGLVVDDAIVIVENTFRHFTHSASRFSAAYLGTKELFGAIIAMTLTLSAVFAPLFFMGGVTGKLFIEYAFTLAASVLISGLIALTLTPMMCARVLPKMQEESRLHQISMQLIEYLQTSYSYLLQRVFQFQWIAISIWLLSILGGFYLYHTLPKELAPQEDQGYMMIVGNGPATANQNYMLNYVPKLNHLLTILPDVKASLLLQGIPNLNSFTAFDILKNRDKRNTSAIALKPPLQTKLNQLVGLNAYVILPSSLPGNDGSSFQMVLLSTADYKILHQYTEQFEREAMTSGYFSYLKNDLNYNHPAYQLDINRFVLTAHHIAMNQISNSLSLLTGDFESGQFNYFGRSYDIILSAFPQYRNNPDQLNLIMIKNKQGNLIPLSSLATMNTKVIPTSLNEFQKQNAATMTGELAPGISLSQAITYSKNLADKLLPEYIHYNYAGQARQYLEEGNDFVQIFALALIVIFLVLSMQFNSMRDALLILLGSVPMALFSALIPLKLGFGDINIYTQIALLTLVGLIVKHGVLMTKFANQLQDKGIAKKAAIFKAAKIRFRPIVMTTIAMALGAIPLVLATGAGSNSRFQMGMTISVGLLIGTCCTLLIFPVLYEQFSKERKSESCHEEVF